MKKTKTALLVGVTGFIGRNLAHVLTHGNLNVYGTFTHGLIPSRAEFDPRISLIACDVTKPKQIERLIKKIKPHFIYYLAALSSVRLSWTDPIRTLQVNFLGGVQLFETVRKLGLRPKIMVFSSGTTYGDSHQGRSLSETAYLRPKDPYSVSKYSLEMFARLYANTYGMQIVIIRLANTTGPGQLTTFSIPNFASQIAKIEAGLAPPIIQVGNLSARRDFLDVRDCMRAIQLVMKKGKAGEAYNVASGKTRSLEDALKIMLVLSKFGKRRINIKSTSSLIPKDEIREIQLSTRKLRRLTGWKPEIQFKQTLSDVLNEWRIKTIS